MEQVSEDNEISQRLSGWKQEVSRIRAGIGELEASLQQRALGLTERSRLAEVEHFQNQFICHKEVADTLYHDLKQAARRMAADTAGDSSSHQALADRTATFLRLYDALETEFTRFGNQSAR